MIFKRCELGEPAASASFSLTKLNFITSHSPKCTCCLPANTLVRLMTNQRVVFFVCMDVTSDRWPVLKPSRFHPVAAAIPHGCRSRDYHGDNPEVEGSVPEVGPPTMPAGSLGATLLPLWRPLFTSSTFLGRPNGWGGAHGQASRRHNLKHEKGQRRQYWKIFVQ